MNCFASSIHVDLDGGVAAFASINAMQGYRPTAVTQYAVQLLRAKHEGKRCRQPEALTDAAEVDNAGEYAGVFRSANGKELVFKADGKKLYCWMELDRSFCNGQAGDSFVSTVPGSFSDYSLIFARQQHERRITPSPVVEVGYGPDWYANAAYHGDREFTAPAAYGALTGRYRSDSGDDVRVFVRKGKLWLGDTPLTEIGSSLFRIGNDSWSPDTAEFLTIVEGHARLLRVIGEDCWRIEVSKHWTASPKAEVALVLIHLSRREKLERKRKNPPALDNPWT